MGVTVQQSMSQIIDDAQDDIEQNAHFRLVASTINNNVFRSRSIISTHSHGFTAQTISRLTSNFQLQTTIRVNLRQLTLTSKLLKEHIPFTIASAELRKNLYRSFHKSSYDPMFKLLLNDEGELIFRWHSFLTTAVQLQHVREAPEFCSFIDNIYLLSLKNFTDSFTRILPLLEPCWEKKFSLISPDKIGRLEILKYNTLFMTFDPEKETHPTLKDVPYVEESYLSSLPFYEAKVESSKSSDKKKFNYFCALWCNLESKKAEIEPIYDKFGINKVREVVKSSLKFLEPKTPKGRNQPDEMLAEIKLEDIDSIQWSKLHEGGFGVLKKGFVKYFLVVEDQLQKGKKKEIHMSPISKIMVVKSDKDVAGRKSRVKLQKEVLRTLGKNKSRFIPQFYYSLQKSRQLNNFIMMDFYPQKSLDYWLKSYGQFASLFTKISLLCFVCYGVKFLHESRIIHRDLKPANILIESKFCIKIIDFGESFHPDIDALIRQRNFSIRPGYTLSYSPPEAFRKGDAPPTQAYDVFSLGVMIIEVIFGKNLLDDMSMENQKKLFEQESLQFERCGHKEGEQYCGRIRLKIFLVVEKLSDLGLTEILTPLVNLVSHCLNPDPARRPTLNWVIAILKQVYTLLLDFYSL